MVGKNKNSDAHQPSEEELLEQRVDAMMDPKRSEEPAAAAAPPALNIFEGVGTAPEVAPDPLKKIGLKENPEAGAKKAASPKADSTAVPVTVKTTEKPPEAAQVPDEPVIIETPADSDDTPLDNPETDKAVDDIAANESDELLAVEDATARHADTAAKAPGGRGRAGAIFKNKWFWLALLVIIAGLFAAPPSRYKLLALAIKKPVTITVLDSQTGTPVSDALVSLAAGSGRTNGDGVAKLKAVPGSDNFSVSKQYYRSVQGKTFVGLRGAAEIHLKLVATGRQVPITVLNKVSGQPVAGAVVTVLNTYAKTNAAGKAFVVLPAAPATDSATISAPGFNLAKISVSVTSGVVPGNSFSLTPSGTVYFLSNASGSIDVVKTDLDGGHRQTVLAGTGHEDPNTTSLLATRDWRYLALEAHRDTAQPALYLIDGKTNKLTAIDTNDSTFELIGWYGHNFIYDSVNNTLSRWQSGRESLHSYNADTDTLTTLDQNQAEGSSTSYAYQGFYNFYLLNDLVTYTTQWYGYAPYASYDLGSKTDSIRAVTPDNQNKKDYQTFAAANLSYIQAVLYKPQTVYYAVGTNDGQLSYDQFDGQKTAQANGIDQSTFSKAYPTYLLSPDGKQTAWSDVRDGQNTLFTGDAAAANQKQINSGGDFAAYGWYGDNYLLVSKNGNELYIMPAGGIGQNQQPFKISDYYKSAQTLPGYGYGYGGL